MTHPVAWSIIAIALFVIGYICGYEAGQISAEQEAADRE